MSSGRNFNRDFPDLLDAVIDSVGERLGSDPAANVALVRQALRRWTPCRRRPELEGMQRLLYRHACDADLVLDLHCDFEAAIHLYTPAAAMARLRLPWPHAWAPLSGCSPIRRRFPDEACSVPWLRLSRLSAPSRWLLPGDHRRTRRPGRYHGAAAEANAAAIRLPRRAGFVEGAGGARSLLLALRRHRIRPRRIPAW